MKCCPEALRAGVREGRTLAEARAVLGRREPSVHPYDLPGDTAALRSLAVFAERFAPTVAVDAPDGLLLDITGCDRLFGGEDRLAEVVGASVHRLGFSARVAVASTAGCAWALARFGDAPPGGVLRAGVPIVRVPIVRVPEGTEREALAPLPVGALRIAPATELALEELGLHTIGDLFPLPRDEVWARFGAELLDRLDRATGHASEPLVPVREEAPRSVERVFDGPVRDPQAIRGATRLLLEALCRELEAARRGAMELRLRFRRADGAVLDEPLCVSRATVDPRHLLALLDPRLERLPMGDGIDEIRVTASRTRRLRQVQASLAGASMGGESNDFADDGLAAEDASRELGRLVDTLAQRCGPRGVVVFRPVESHWPERAFAAHVPFEDMKGPFEDMKGPFEGAKGPFEKAMATGRTGVRNDGGAGDAGAGDGTPLGDRPSLLFPVPEDAEVSLDARARPATIAWRGRTRRVVASAGPERIAVPWWDRGAAAAGATASDDPATERDYFRVADDGGRWLWVFRAGARWFVHGEWA